MNWLAHIFLSDIRIDYQLGNLLADLLKGKSWDGASPAFEQGMSMHRTIDRYTDQHPCFLLSKSRLGPRGRLRGVVVDILFDHLLAKNWPRYATIPFDDFILQFREGSQSAAATYPEQAQTFINRLNQSEHLWHYQSFQGVEEALRRVDHRLSSRLLSRESCQNYLPLARQEIAPLETDFLQFMPELIAHFKSESGLTFADHWLR